MALTITNKDNKYGHGCYSSKKNKNTDHNISDKLYVENTKSLNKIDKSFNDIFTQISVLDQKYKIIDICVMK